MAKAKHVTLHRRAAMALSAFPPKDRARIERAVRWLVDNAGKVQLRARTAKLATPDPLYIMRATPTIRLIYRKTAAGDRGPRYR
jgi:hypothetical protein